MNDDTVRRYFLILGAPRRSAPRASFLSSVWEDVIQYTRDVGDLHSIYSTAKQGRVSPAPSLCTVAVWVCERALGTCV